MPVLERIKQILKPLGLYELDGTTQVDRELECYAGVLEKAWSKAEQLKRECFLMTAEGDGLSLWEQLAGMTIPSGFTETERRELLQRCFSRKIGEWDRIWIAEELALAGFSVTLQEEGERLRVQGAGKETEYERLRQLCGLCDKLLPAHLSFYFDIPARDWNALESPGFSFDQWDYLNFQWDLFGE